MAAYQQVTIVGVGLIGGSIGLALKAKGLADRVVGAVRKEDRVAKVLACGVVDTATTDLAKAVADANVVVVCTPVATIAETVREVAKHCPSAALVIDAGSTKANIANDLAEMPSPAFVGCHPLAGHHATGPEAATATLFKAKTAVVTPLETTSSEAVDRAEAFWRALGASVLRMTPEEHDKAVAYTSHMPHSVATILAATDFSFSKDNSFSELEDWKRTTRIAAGSPSLWLQILLDNSSAAREALGKFGDELDKTTKAVVANSTRKRTIIRKAKEKQKLLALATKQPSVTKKINKTILGFGNALSLQHLVAISTVNATPEQCIGLVSTGWSDTTRTVSQMDNIDRIVLADAVSANLVNFRAKLRDFENALMSRNRSTLEKILREGKERRDAVGN